MTMTTRTIVFDSPFLLGFEHTRLLIERAAKAAAETYPPYNVEQLADDRLRITLAVAGFSPDQLHVTVENRQLVVAGRRDQDSVDPRQDSQGYLHRGIAARGFMRTFVLADGMEVDGATLEHGLLHVDVVRPESEPVAKRIPIRAAG
ncbi:MAG TPA: Hsp20 family protein [Steroidobacteraceae bacterium]